MKMIEKIKNIVASCKLHVASCKSKILALGACFLALASCSSESINEPEIPAAEPTEASNKLYININVVLPDATGSRSGTTTDGESDNDPNEYQALYNENVINGIDLFFCTYDEEGNDTPVFRINDKNMMIDFNISEDKTATITVEVDPNELLKLVGNKNVRVYIAGNCTEDAFPDAWNGGFNAFSAKNTDIWDTKYDIPTGGRNIPLVNEDYLEVTSFEDLSKVDLEKFIAGEDNDDFDELALSVREEVGKLFDNYKVELERLFARVDYRDRTKGDFIYPFKYDEENPEVYVKLMTMQPFNMEKNCYIFRHTSPGTNASATFDEQKNDYVQKLFGNERGTDGYTWILDSDAKIKHDRALNWNNGVQVNFDNKVIQSINKVKSGGNVPAINLSDLVSESRYHYTETYDYYPFYYFSENTLPSTSAMIKGLSSGIAFRAYLCDGNGTPISSSEELENLGFSLGETNITPTDNQTGDFYEMSKGDEKTIVEKINITIGEGEDAQEKDAYVLTYWYFIRHNISAYHTPGVIEPMEFGVVRNNIYRIAVEGFDGLPVPYDPEKPDEDPASPAILVNLNVLSWAKHNVTMEW